MAYRRSHGVDTRIARIFNTYGPYMDPEDGRVVSNFIVQALKGDPLTVYGDGKQSRDYMFVTDAADAYTRLGLADNVVGQAMNIGTGIETDIATLARLIIKIMGAKMEPNFTGKISPGEAGRLVCNPTKGMKLLDWKPTVSLEDGLKSTVDYYLKNAHLYNYSKFTI